MRDVALASLTLPTHFDPVSVELGSRTYRLVHGGLVANNPSLFAFAMAAEENDRRGLDLLSLGTGRSGSNWQSRPTSAPRQGQRWPLGFSEQFAAHLATSSEAHHQVLEALLRVNGNQSRYWRIQPDLQGELPDSGPGHKGDPATLAAVAERVVRDEQLALMEISEALIG
jgi:hypothetical protein